jgi:hypothetical protein
MPNQPTAAMSHHLQTLGNVVPEGYSYYEKMVTPGEDLSLPHAYLKWYDIYPLDAKNSEGHIAEARAFLQAETQTLNLKDELGFVILHRAGSVLLLMLMTWRNTNEIWESVYFKDVTQTDEYQLVPFDGTHRGTYCVWELGPVWHERHAWVRFLSSKRDEAAKWAYINDRFSGRV